jgi:NodT family efflux transporter outer membrane factor (OMF) lipoprotein
MQPTLRLAAAAAALTLSGCVVGPDYHRPDVALPAHFQTPGPQARSAQSANAPASLDAWWSAFDDPGLVRVVERAQAANLDIAQARARILQSRALAKAAGAALAPQADASLSAAHEEQSLLSPIGEIGRNLPGYQRAVPLYDVGVAASWEIDLFGGLRRQLQASLADARASEASATAVRISVSADAADAYLQVRAYQARIAVARRQEAIEQDLVDLLTRRSNQGVAADRELRLTKAELEGVRASIPPLQFGLEAQLNRLDVLMGAAPGTYRSELSVEGPIPAPPTIATGAPVELLRRRPDVIAAEQRLMASNARIGAAISDYYPKLSIIGLLGVESVDASRLFVGNAVQHQVAAGLRWRLFDFGRVDAEVAQAKGAQAEALAAYRSSILHASEDVENALSDQVQQQVRAQALGRQIAELTVARAQSQEAYEGGVVSLIEVRDADRNLLTAADQLAQAKADAARAAVATFRALGGGWPAGAAINTASNSPDPEHRGGARAPTSGDS